MDKIRIRVVGFDSEHLVFSEIYAMKPISFLRDSRTLEMERTIIKNAFFEKYPWLKKNSSRLYIGGIPVCRRQMGQDLYKIESGDLYMGSIGVEKRYK